MLLFLYGGGSIAGAEALTFERVLGDALKNAYENRIILEKIESARAGVKEARANLYPSLSLRFGNEYAHVFKESSETISVGDAVLTDDTSGYKNSLIVYAQYTLYDFGVRRLTINHAQAKVSIAELYLQQARRELALTLLDLFTKGLRIQEYIRATTEICAARKTIYRTVKKLQAAGLTGRDTVGEAALSLAEAVAELEDRRTELNDLMAEIDFHTCRSHDPDAVVFQSLSPIDTPGSNGVKARIDLTNHPEIAILNRQITDKRTELSIARRSRLPVFNLYGDFRNFGNAERSYADSLSDLRERDASITLYLEYPLFDGFKNSAAQERLRHEINGLRQRKRKREAELRREYTKAQNTYISLEKSEGQRTDVKALILRQDAFRRRLDGANQQDRVTFLKQMIQLILRRRNLALRQIEFASSGRRIELLSREGSI